jgi:hypothetical protein
MYMKRFHIGQRVEVHLSLEQGKVVYVGRVYVKVLMDRSRNILRLRPRNLRKLGLQ